MKGIDKKSNFASGDCRPFDENQFEGYYTKRAVSNLAQTAKKVQKSAFFCVFFHASVTSKLLEI